MSGEYTAFFYGTLMAPEVFFAVCYGCSSPPKAVCDLYTFTPAILRDHCRHRVCDVDYPAVVPEKGHKVRGIYATGLTQANMGKLDAFEGAEYERVQVKVQLLDSEGQEISGNSRDTFVYVFRLPQLLDRREWDYDEFRRDKMMMGWTRGERDFVRVAGIKTDNGEID